MVTTMIETETEKPEASPKQPPISPRKRRRRAPTSGAADDCFSCQERQGKCDRRRPYCSPCLDQGKDCSGYKTTLTWGVGVASRGKLRGLALPIADSRKAEQDTDKKLENSRKRSLNEFSKLGPDRDSPPSTTNIRAFESRSGSASAGSTAASFDFVNSDHNTATPSPMLPPPNLRWRAPGGHGSRAQPAGRPSKRIRSHSLEPLQVAPAQQLGALRNLPLTANAVGRFQDHQYGFSMQYSPITPTFSNHNAYSPSYPDFSVQHDSGCHQAVPESPFDSAFFPEPEMSWSGDSISSSLGSDHSSQDYQEDQGFFADPVVADSLDSILSNQQSIGQSNGVFQNTGKTQEAPQYLDQLLLSPQLVPDDVGVHPSSIISTPFTSTSIGKTPGLRFLIDYYDKVISPVIVAFDGPTNPYRTHILRLAVESKTLQHAIAALSASNLRIRRGSSNPVKGCKRRSLTDCSYDKSVRRSSIAHSIMEGDLDSLPQTSMTEPSMEELFHKSASIKALNEQLKDPKRRKDDSILATLLILCLYHICDTGVAKFKTQFAGVKQILAMRGGTKGPNSKASNWLTVMFTWFDAMTATVNDRESQLPDLDVSGDDGWSLENLAGCDGRLFKIIAKLGRLNLLSQGRPVEDTPPEITARPKTRSSSPNSKSQDYYSMNYSRYDGNGWSSLLDDDDDLASRTPFWREWTTTRRALQDWQLDPVNPSSPSSRFDRLDLLHISESFRYSALLYTERLAYPHLPSTHPNFQNLVTQALYHITNVKSDVFLLWPLFITGTECVSPGDRHLIRERCLDIQKDSGFFNNISGLELLEKVWRDDTKDTIEHNHGSMTGMNHTEGSCAVQGFKWRKAMERIDGEYIVV